MRLPIVIVTLVTVAEILQVFVLMTPIFQPNFGGVPVGPDRRRWGQSEVSGLSRYLKLISREIIFEVFIHYVITIPERHKRTDRQ